MPVTVAPVIAKTVPVRLYRDRQRRAVYDGRGQGARRRPDRQRPFQGRRRSPPGRSCCSRSTRGRSQATPQAGAGQSAASDKALLDRAAEQEKRYKDLLEKNFISPDAYEPGEHQHWTAPRPRSAADEAAIESAKLQLEYCTIRSPITGYAGKIMIQQGNLVKANDTGPLVTINQVVPIYASFSVPEQNLSDIRTYQAKGELQVQANLANVATTPIEGKLIFVDNSADMTTGTIKLKAEFPNTDKALWPGQFVNVALTLYEQKDAIVAPSAAVQNGPNGQYVFVVKAGHDRRAAQRSRSRAPRATTPSSPSGLTARRAGRHRRTAAAWRRACRSSVERGDEPS